jgi:phosphatidylserine/phosphatidylglycerophosphate/cardiolipin synthase-like enzyme
MRFAGQADGISVRVISGTYVVMIAMDATETAKNDLLGFAIHRTDTTENEEYWLKGMRTFRSVYPNPPAGSLVSTHDHPIQDFLWSDFTAKPGHDYVYEIVPVRGKPKNLTYGTTVRIDVRTESEEGRHAVYFNRGVIGSQAYAREFHNTDPRKLKGDEQKKAYEWLSRGLYEAMRDFIREATGPQFALRAAVYEFSYEPIIEEFQQAKKRCKDVQIVYDARIKTSDPKKTEHKRVALTKRLLKKYGLDAKTVSTPRTATPNAIAHNKFIVLLRENEPVAVWTGSTNFTESGIFGQSNVGHIVRDPDVAALYLKYWLRLKKNQEVPALRTDNMAVDPDLAGFPPSEPIAALFSPRKKDKSKHSMLDWYADAMSHGQLLLCFTAAFGVNQVFLDVLDTPTQPDDDLRYLFLEKWGVNKNLAAKAKGELAKNRNNIVAVGGYLAGDVLHQYLHDRWAAECANMLSTNVKYTHTKYMLIDPLGGNPVVISGSANFSEASTVTNDENMLVITGDTRVADIYLGEFMRLWHHYRYRSITNKNADKDTGDEQGYEPNYLDENDAWTVSFFKPGTFKYKRRRTFMQVDGIAARAMAHRAGR